MNQINNIIESLQKKIAISAIGPSALRNQGKGILLKAQYYCGSINLNKFSVKTNNEYLSQMGIETEKMIELFNLKQKPWGTARKAINLFLRDAVYNKYLSKLYKLNSIEKYLEIPLDSAVAKGLKKRDEEKKLPKWPGLKYLTSEISNKFQHFAKKEAERENLYRINLDILLWLENR